MKTISTILKFLTDKEISFVILITRKKSAVWHSLDSAWTYSINTKLQANEIVLVKKNGNSSV